MATEILAVAAGAATSADFTFTADTSVFLKDADGGSIPRGARVYVEAKDDDAQYTLIGDISWQMTGGILPAGTYRFRRKGNGVSVGAAHA